MTVFVEATSVMMPSKWRASSRSNHSRAAETGVAMMTRSLAPGMSHPSAFGSSETA